MEIPAPRPRRARRAPVTRTLALWALLGCTQPAEAPDPAPRSGDHDAPVAVVDGVVLGRAALEAEARARAARTGRTLDSVLEAEVLWSQIDRALLLRDAERLQVLPSPEALETGWAREVARLGGPERLPGLLERRGLSEAEAKRRHAERAVARAVRTHLAAAVTVTPEEIEAEYTRDPARFTEPLRRAVTRIHVPWAGDDEAARQAALARARPAVAALERGAAAQAWASRLGEGARAMNGGAPEWLAPGQLPPALEAALAELRIGGAAAVPLPGGLVLVRKDQERPATLRPLAEVAGELERALLAERRASVLEGAFRRWRAEAELQILDPELAAHLAPPPDAELCAPGKLPE